MTLERLDPSSPAERAAYERAFYAAFRRARGNRLIRQLWVWDDAEKRLATRLPYEEQWIYTLRDAAGDVAIGLAVNHALREFQASAYGFPPPSDRRGACEFLTCFTVAEHRLPTTFRFWRAAFADLAARGFHTGYATCAPRVLPFWRRMGARLLAECEIDDEVRHFLAFELGRTEWRGGRATEQRNWTGSVQDHGCEGKRMVSTLLMGGGCGALRPEML